MHKFLLLTLFPLLTACGSSYPSDLIASNSGPVLITLLDDQDQPIRNQSLSFSVEPYRIGGSSGSPKQEQAVTDAQGRFRAPCALNCRLQIEAPAYSVFVGTYSDPPRIRLAAHSPEQLAAKAEPVQKLLDVRLEGHSDFRALGTLAGTHITAFEIRTEAGLKSFKQRLADLQGLSYGSGAAETNLPELPAGQRLLVYSSNQASPAQTEAETVWRAPGAYYFTDRQSELLTQPVGLEAHKIFESHTLLNPQDDKIRLAVVALPDDGRKLVFHARQGRFELGAQPEPVR